MTVKIINCDPITAHNSVKMFTQGDWFYAVQHYAARYFNVEIIEPDQVDYSHRNVLFLCVDNPFLLKEFDLDHFKQTIIDNKNLTIYVSFSLEFWLDGGVLEFILKLLNNYPLARFFWGGANEYHNNTIDWWMSQQRDNHYRSKADWTRVNMVPMPILDAGYCNYVKNKEPLPEKLPLKKKFLMMNAKVKPARAALYLWCNYNNVLNNSYYSWRMDAPELLNRRSPWTFSQAEKEFLKKTVELDPENTVDIIAKQWDTPRYMSVTSFMHVVIETLFDEIDNGAPSLFLTEKTYKPIYLKQPFIMVARPHTLKHLRMLGYKTFDSIIDESYDNIEDSVLRMNAICKEIAKINAMSLDQLEILREQVKDIVEFNHNHMFTDPGQLVRKRSLEKILLG